MTSVVKVIHLFLYVLIQATIYSFDKEGVDVNLNFTLTISFRRDDDQKEFLYDEVQLQAKYMLEADNDVLYPKVLNFEV